MIVLFDKNVIKNDKEKPQDRYARLYVGEGSLKVSYSYKESEKTDTVWFEKVFCFDQIQYAPDKCNIVFSPKSKHGLSFQWMSDICEDKIGDYYNKFRYEANNDVSRVKVLSIFVNKDNEIYIIPYVPFIIEKISESVEVNNSSIDTNSLCKEINHYDCFTRRIEAKRNLISKINILDCLSSLEAQIDLIADELLSNESSLKPIYNSFSVMTVHDKSKILKTIENNKSHLRNIQKQYFLEKGDCPSNRKGA